MAFTRGVDYGTNSVRAIVVDCSNGLEVGSGVVDYPSEIDMDFMNLNQAAHGDREAGFIHTRLRLNRKVVVGHWSDEQVQDRIAAWMRVVRAWADWQGAKFVRFDDNMREVAVTEGDKVSAEAKFGYSVDGYGIGDLVQHVEGVSDKAIGKLCAEYEERYNVAEESWW